jgi:hypothetical protein
MLSTTAFARQLDVSLNQVGNGIEAVKALQVALDRFEPIDNGEPGSEDWEEYDRYLDRLDASREYPPIGSPLATAWERWLRASAEVPDDVDVTTF